MSTHSPHIDALKHIKHNYTLET